MISSAVLVIRSAVQCSLSHRQCSLSHSMHACPVELHVIRICSMHLLWHTQVLPFLPKSYAHPHVLMCVQKSCIYTKAVNVWLQQLNVRSKRMCVCSRQSQCVCADRHMCVCADPLSCLCSRCLVCCACLVCGDGVLRSVTWSLCLNTPDASLRFSVCVTYALVCMCGVCCELLSRPDDTQTRQLVSLSTDR